MSIPLLIITKTYGLHLALVFGRVGVVVVCCLLSIGFVPPVYLETLQSRDTATLEFIVTFFTGPTPLYYCLFPFYCVVSTFNLLKATILLSLLRSFIIDQSTSNLTPKNRILWPFKNQRNSYDSTDVYVGTWQFERDISI